MKTAKLYPELAEVFIRPFYERIQTWQPTDPAAIKRFPAKDLASQHNLPMRTARKLQKVFNLWLELSFRPEFGVRGIERLKRCTFSYWQRPGQQTLICDLRICPWCRVAWAERCWPLPSSAWDHLQAPMLTSQSHLRRP